MSATQPLYHTFPLCLLTKCEISASTLDIFDEMCYNGDMNKSFEKKLVKLFRDGKKLELLEYSYVALFVVVTLVAGLIALINQAVGVSFLIVPLICLVSWSMNLVAWSIVKTAMEHFYPDEEVFPNKDLDKIFEKEEKVKAEKAEKKTNKKIKKED